jgi:hypothetical protein
MAREDKALEIFGREMMNLRSQETISKYSFNGSSPQ